MRKLAVLVLDALFTFGLLGFAATVLWIMAMLLSRLFGARMTSDLLSTWGTSLLLGTLILWVALTGLIVADSWQNWRRNGARSALWLRILFAQLFVVGPTAYYLSAFRPRLSGGAARRVLYSLRQNRVLLDCLSYLTVWGTVVGFASIAASLVIRPSPETVRVLFSLACLAIPVSGLSHLALSLVLVIDASERSEQEWEERDFVRLLNPWSWVAGTRRYYWEVLRPEIRVARSSHGR